MGVFIKSTPNLNGLVKTKPICFNAYSSICIHRINKCAGTMEVIIKSTPDRHGLVKTDHMINLLSSIYAIKEWYVLLI